MTGKRGPAPWRFWNYVDKHGPLPEHRPELGPCWLWMKKPERNGYAKWRPHHGGPSTTVHRYAYEQEVGSIPDGLELDHLCHRRICVNPSHLEPVTHQVNKQRAVQTHCKMGHALIAGNVYETKRTNGYTERRCRTCGLERSRQYQQRHARHPTKS